MFFIFSIYRTNKLRYSISNNIVIQFSKPMKKLILATLLCLAWMGQAGTVVVGNGNTVMGGNNLVKGDNNFQNGDQTLIIGSDNFNQGSNR